MKVLAGFAIGVALVFGAACKGNAPQQTTEEQPQEAELQPEQQPGEQPEEQPALEDQPEDELPVSAPPEAAADPRNFGTNGEELMDLSETATTATEGAAVDEGAEYDRVDAGPSDSP